MWKKVLKSIAKGCGLSVMRYRHLREYELRLEQARECEARLEQARGCEARLEQAERDLKLCLARAEGASDIPRLPVEVATGGASLAGCGGATGDGRNAARVGAANAGTGRRADGAFQAVRAGRGGERRPARQLAAEGDEASALRYYANALSLIHRYEPARQDLREISQRNFEEASALLAAGNHVEARARLVKAVEHDPTNRPARERLGEQLRAQKRGTSPRNATSIPIGIAASSCTGKPSCALEYVGCAGVTGEVLEFGVLGGFTARIACETMRDMLIFKQIHLFDSFDGLPEYKSPIDANSYEIAGRNVWADRMRIPDWLVRELGVPIEVHVLTSLSEVIGPERVFIHRGYFEETLQRPLPFKAALIHIDCDLYQSTKEVLARLSEMDVLQDGCIILFDDYNCFKASPYAGERLAFREFLEGQGRFESTPFFTYGYNGAAFFLHEKQVNVQVRAA